MNDIFGVSKNASIWGMGYLILKGEVDSLRIKRRELDLMKENFDKKINQVQSVYNAQGKRTDYQDRRLFDQVA